MNISKGPFSGVNEATWETVTVRRKCIIADGNTLTSWSKYILCSSVFLCFSGRGRRSSCTRLPAKTLGNVASQLQCSSHSSRLTRPVISRLLFLCRLYRFSLGDVVGKRIQGKRCSLNVKPRSGLQRIWEVVFEKPLRADRQPSTETCVHGKPCSGAGLHSERPYDRDSASCCMLCLFAICVMSIKDSQPLHFWSISSGV